MYWDEIAAADVIFLPVIFCWLIPATAKAKAAYNGLNFFEIAELNSFYLIV